MYFLCACEWVRKWVGDECLLFSIDFNTILKFERNCETPSFGQDRQKAKNASFMSKLNGEKSITRLLFLSFLLMLTCGATDVLLGLVKSQIGDCSFPFSSQISIYISTYLILILSTF